MNIIKIADTKIDESMGFTADEVKLFNETFRDCYVQVINWTYCVPLEDLQNQQIRDISQELCNHFEK
jgi:hypothetical protein